MTECLCEPPCRSILHATIFNSRLPPNVWCTFIFVLYQTLSLTSLEITQAYITHWLNLWTDFLLFAACTVRAMSVDKYVIHLARSCTLPPHIWQPQKITLISKSLTLRYPLQSWWDTSETVHNWKALDFEVLRATLEAFRFVFKGDFRCVEN